LTAISAEQTRYLNANLPFGLAFAGEIRYTRLVEMTQRITAADIKAGRIRVPGQTKALFPQQPTSVDVQLRGMRKSCAWNPRYGPDKTRSGVLGIGKDLAYRLTEGERLRVRAAGDVFYLE
jgi:hypothetical protein